MAAVPPLGPSKHAVALEEYRGCGARLGWLIDPVERRVHIYRPGIEVETLDAPATVTGDPVLRGFVLDLRRIW